MKRSRFLFGCVGVLVGCTDPVVGTWEADVESTNYEMTLESDGTGEAVVKIDNISGSLTFEISWKKNNDEYDFEVECDKGKLEACDADGFCIELGCNDVDDSEWTCSLNDAGDEMDCEVEDCNDCSDLDFEKQAD